jgi:hypothetical protein
MASPLAQLLGRAVGAPMMPGPGAAVAAPPRPPMPGVKKPPLPGVKPPAAGKPPVKAPPKKGGK